MAGERIDVVQPHNRKAQLGTLGDATADDVRQAVDAAKAAAPAWQRMSFDDRAAIFLKAADLLTGPWRATLNAATMLGQSKTCYQAEIDAACEMADFWRFNVGFAREILQEQPVSGPGVWNRLDHRPLEGFVLAITPFNFTAIAGNLSTAPALMGNTVVWKPAPTQQLSAHYTMRLLEAAGLPPGVVNMVTGGGAGGQRGRAARSGVGWYPFHRVNGDVRPSVGLGRGEPACLSGVPALGRGDRREGLRRGPSLRRHRRPAGRPGAGRLRVPGPEVLSGLPRLRAALVVDQDA